MKKETPNMLTKTQVKDRGWTEAGINKFLGNADATKPNPMYGNASPMKLFLEDRVVSTEQSPEFQAWAEKSKARRRSAKRAVDTKKKKTITEYADFKVSLPKMKKWALLKSAVEHYNNLNLARGTENYATGKEDEEFLHRIMVNYLRHVATEYDAQLLSTYSKVGKNEVIALIRKRIFEAIATQYPYLAEECKRQAEQKGLVLKDALDRR